MSDLDDLIRELDESAARLRGGELDALGAAELVERCAELAARVGAELDHAGREAAAPAEGQEQLL